MPGSSRKKRVFSQTIASKTPTFSREKVGKRASYTSKRGRSGKLLAGGVFAKNR